MQQSIVAQVFADEWPRLVATLVRELGDIDLAEDAAQQAFTEAAASWRPDNTPNRPGAWLLTTARRRAIDVIRRKSTLREKMGRQVPDAEAVDVAASVGGDGDAGGFGSDHPEANQLLDDQLALIFGCCHPALNREAQIALTLRSVCGLSTRQIAAAFLVPEATMAKRLVRAKDKVRNAGIPFTVPARERLTERLDSVLAVVYLIYTEGHTASDGPALIRGGLCDEARWLADLVADLLPDQAEAWGLSALINLTDSRRETRVDADGQIVLLANQDRSRWDTEMIEAGRRRLVHADRLDDTGPYQLQAAIALVHAMAPTAEETRWTTIVTLYDHLLGFEPTPIVGLNRAAAVSKAYGPAAGLEALDELMAEPQASSELDSYRYYHAARADMFLRLERPAEAADSYRHALDLTTNDSERDFLTGRLAETRNLQRERH
ncbi:MAG: hypothetical protein OEZ14_06730 [Acidimicrobiia bacterium]|nr:hypothetical protein [Acidimicrobiia bacterium]